MSRTMARLSGPEMNEGDWEQVDGDGEDEDEDERTRE